MSFLHQLTLRLFRLAYCGGLVVDRRRPLQAAHRLVSLVLWCGLMSLYFFLLRVLYVLFQAKLPDVVIYGVIGSISLLAWYGFKSWQFRHLRVAQAAVPRCYTRR